MVTQRLRLECKMAQPLWKTVWQFHKRLARITMPPNNHQGTYTQKVLKMGLQTDSASVTIYCGISHTSQKVETTAAHQEMN